MQLATGVRMLFALLTAVTTQLGHAQSFHDLIVTEIMADPTPAIGLPDAEYLEIHNRTNGPLSLKGLRLEFGARSAFLPDSIIAPNGYLIVCGSSNSAKFSGMGKIVGISNFNLPNDGATVTIRNPNGALIFSFNYTLSWWPASYRDGGYALEMINTDYPCVETGNWAVSPDPSGGTPGRTNAAFGLLEDHSPPRIDRLEIISNYNIQVVFSEKLDSLSLIQATISVTGNTISTRKLLSPDLRVLDLQLTTPLLTDVGYALSVSGLTDCTGNQMEPVIYPFGLPSEPVPGDVIINELLFNPKADGVDFIEIYNRSSKFINLRNWQLANIRNGLTDVTRTITTGNYLLSPYTCLALTTLPNVVRAHYPAAETGNYLTVPSLPSYPNASGGTILQTGDIVLDRVEYSEKMHYRLLSLVKGVSLERIDPTEAGSNYTNWHSASSLAGYATPGLPNSQLIQSSEQVLFHPHPEVFSPNGDGHDDLTQIHYRLSKPGHLATLTIWDITGRKIKTLCNRSLLGTSGTIPWDGTRDDGQTVNTGYYLLLVELFTINGTFDTYRRKIDIVK